MISNSTEPARVSIRDSSHEVTPHKEFSAQSPNSIESVPLKLDSLAVPSKSVLLNENNQMGSTSCDNCDKSSGSSDVVEIARAAILAAEKASAAAWAACQLVANTRK